MKCTPELLATPWPVRCQFAMTYRREGTRAFVQLIAEQPGGDEENAMQMVNSIEVSLN